MPYDVHLGYDTDWQASSPSSFTYHLGQARGNQTTALQTYQAAQQSADAQGANTMTTTNNPNGVGSGLLSGWGPGPTAQEAGLSDADALKYYQHTIDLAKAMDVDTAGWTATATGIVYGTPSSSPQVPATPTTPTTTSPPDASSPDPHGVGTGLLSGWNPGAPAAGTGSTGTGGTGGGTGTGTVPQGGTGGTASGGGTGGGTGGTYTPPSGTTGGGTGSGGLLTTPITPTPTTAHGLQSATATPATAVNVTVDPTKTVQGLYDTYSQRDTVAKQLAETRSRQQAESSGLLNSSIAVGAVQAARDAVDMATAQADANTYANAAQTNAQLGTNVNLSNAAANNSMSQFNANWTNDLVKLDQQFKNSIALAAVDEATQLRLMQAQQTFQASQTALDRELTRWQHTTPSASQADSNVSGTLQRLAALPGDVANQLANIAAVEDMSDGAKAAAMNQIITAAIGQQQIMLSQLRMYNFTPSVSFDFNSLRPGYTGPVTSGGTSGGGGSGGNQPDIGA